MNAALQTPCDTVWLGGSVRMRPDTRDLVLRDCEKFCFRYSYRMSQLTISLSDSLAAQMDERARAAGFASKEDYLLDLIQSDCEQVELESKLEERLNGPFAPLESDWKERVRQAAKNRG